MSGRSSGACYETKALKSRCSDAKEDYFGILFLLDLNNKLREQIYKDYEEQSYDEQSHEKLGVVFDLFCVADLWRMGHRFDR